MQLCCLRRSAGLDHDHSWSQLIILMQTIRKNIFDHLKMIRTMIDTKNSDCMGRLGPRTVQHQASCHGNHQVLHFTATNSLVEIWQAKDTENKPQFGRLSPHGSIHRKVVKVLSLTSLQSFTRMICSRRSPSSLNVCCSRERERERERERGGGGGGGRERERERERERNQL